MNPYGEVVKEFNHGIATVNGHSYAEKKIREHKFCNSCKHILYRAFS